MFLSKIELDLSYPRVRSTIYDAQRMHQILESLFSLPRKDSSVLYRYKLSGNHALVYLYSSVQPEECKTIPGVSIKAVKDISRIVSELTAGETYSFDLVTMPFKKVAENSGNNSRRRVLRTREERETWLHTKAGQNGFQILSLEEYSGGKTFARHPSEKGGALYMNVYRYSGVLLIQDAEMFRTAIQTGIGPGKAYGLGMLLIKW